MKNVNEIKNAIRESKCYNRSAWFRGVKDYAYEMLDLLTYEIESKRIDLEQITTKAELRKVLLRGADDWNEYSYCGCTLIWDGDIAERLCTPSELKRTHNGEKAPNARETWFDVQTRALRQAFYLVYINAF